MRRLDWSRQEAVAAARRDGQDALELAHRTIRDHETVVFLLAMLARISAAEGDPAQAGRLWGAVESAERAAPMVIWAQHRDRYAAPVLASTGAEFESGREQGLRLTLDQAVEAALALDARPAP